MKAALAFALVFPTVYTLGYFVIFAEQQDAVQAVFAVSKVIQFTFPVVLLVAIRKERIVLQRPTTRGLLAGGLFGLTLLLAMLALYHGWLTPAGFFDEPAKMVREKVQGLGLNSAWKFAAAGVFYSLAHSLLEEYYWRWFVFGQLRKFCALPTAVAVSSLGFMAHHVVVLATFFGWSNPATYLFSAAVAIGGSIWAWLYERSGSLYGPWLCHALVDAAIFSIGYDLVFG